MKESELSCRYGHIWWGHKALEQRFTPASYLESTITTAKNPIMSEASAAAFKIFLGGRDGGNNSGILGCRFTPDYENKTILKVGLLNYEPLYFRAEPGITSELAEVVLKQAAIDIEENDIPGAGTLVFDIGANSAVHSGTRIFRLLTRVVLRLLDPRTEWNEKLAEQFIQAEIRRMDAAKE